MSKSLCRLTSVLTPSWLNTAYANFLSLESASQLKIDYTEPYSSILILTRLHFCTQHVALSGTPTLMSSALFRKSPLLADCRRSRNSDGHAIWSAQYLDTIRSIELYSPWLLWTNILVKSNTSFYKSLYFTLYTGYITKETNETLFSTELLLFWVIL